MWKVIENYINQHRQTLDLEEPGTHVWQAIEHKLDARAFEKTGMGQWRYMKAAAAVVISVGLGYLLSRAYPDGKVAYSSALDTTVACEEVDRKASQLEETFERSEEMADSAKNYDPATFAGSGSYQQSIQELKPAYQQLKARLQQEDCNRKLLQDLEAHTAKRRSLMNQFSDQIESQQPN